jgi:hypothetical protein
MKRRAAALVLILGALLLAACGGGSGSSTNDEGQWVEELQTVMTAGGKTIEADEEKINSATTRKSLEAAYRAYAGRLAAVGAKLRDTEAPAACSSVKSHVVHSLTEFGSITGELGHLSSLGEQQFDALVRQDTAAAQAFAKMMEGIASKGHC